MKLGGFSSFLFFDSDGMQMMCMQMMPYLSGIKEKKGHFMLFFRRFFCLQKKTCCFVVFPCLIFRVINNLFKFLIIKTLIRNEKHTMTIPSEFCFLRFSFLSFLVSMIGLEIFFVLIFYTIFCCSDFLLNLLVFIFPAYLTII